jgi:hypothetical protein
MNTKFYLIILSIGLVLFLAGCIAYKNNNLPPIAKQDLQFSSSKKTKIFSRWISNSAKSHSNSAQINKSNILKKEFDRIVNLSNCCELVDNSEKAEVIVEGEDFNDNDKVPPGVIISGLTFYIIPSWIELKKHIVVKVKNHSTTSSYDLKDSITMVSWLPLAIIAPFRDSPFKLEDQMLDNVLNTLLMKMKNDKFIAYN